MQQGMRILGLGLMTALWLGIGTGARAQEVNLMQGVTPRPGDDANDCGRTNSRRMVRGRSA